MAWKEVGPFATAVEPADLDVVELRVDVRLCDLVFDWSAKVENKFRMITLVNEMIGLLMINNEHGNCCVLSEFLPFWSLMLFWFST